MIGYEEALTLLAKAAFKRGTTGLEKVPLSKSLGRIVAKRISSAEPHPLFDNSSMDGYAIRAVDAAHIPARLPVKGIFVAGDAPGKVAPGAAYEITTGAPLPKGCDAIVPVEHVVKKESGRVIEISEPTEAGDFVRRRGADIQAGDPIVYPGTRLEPRHLLALATLGHTTVAVLKKPKVVIISTGAELVAPERKPGPGQVRNASTSFLLAALTKAGADPVWKGNVADKPEVFKKKVKSALKSSPDILITTGAVSMGRHDFIPFSLKSLGAEAYFHKVAIRPGKPLFAARFKRGPLVFGLPGNPVSTVVGMRFFILPVLRRMLGLPAEVPKKMPLAAAVKKPEGLRCFYKARRLRGRVHILKGQASFQLAPLLSADCWAILPESSSQLAAGTLVEVYPV